MSERFPIDGAQVTRTERDGQGVSAVGDVAASVAAKAA